MYEGEARLLLADPRNRGVLDTARLSSIRRATSATRRKWSSQRPWPCGTLELVDQHLTVEGLGERVQAQPSIDLDLITIRALAPRRRGRQR